MDSILTQVLGSLFQTSKVNRVWDSYETIQTEQAPSHNDWGHHSGIPSLHPIPQPVPAHFVPKWRKLLFHRHSPSDCNTNNSACSGTCSTDTVDKLWLWKCMSLLSPECGEHCYLKEFRTVLNKRNLFDLISTSEYQPRWSAQHP